MKLLLCFFSFFFLTNASLAETPIFKLTNTSSLQSLNPDQIWVIERFLEEATYFLPPKMIEKAGRTIGVSFIPFEGDKKYNRTEIEPPRCDWNTPHPELIGLSKEDIIDRSQKFAFVAGKNIYLNELWIKDILAGPKAARTFSCGHKNLYQAALGTLVHEYSHIYDKNSNFPSLSEEFKRLGHWKTGSFWWSGSENKNITRIRSPDPYEYFNTEEGFAVNLEFYLLDPEYRCRRPSFYNYFNSEHFNSWTAFPSFICRTNTEVLAYDYVLDTIIKSDLNPERVYEIDYLLADRTDSFASRWGHAMYRLIICSPEVEKIGPHCRGGINTAFHRVVSYRANIQDIQISKWKSLVGGYPSLLFILTLTGVVQEYNKEELRDLISIPLKLSDFEKNNFVYKVLENQWDYIGKYMFINNNCATESRDLLKSVSWDPTVNQIKTLTPIGLYQELADAGYIDQELKSKIDFNKKNPYIFPKQMEELKIGTYLFKAPIDRLTHSKSVIERALIDENLIKEADLSEIDNIVEYQEKIPAVKRQELFNQLMTIYKNKNKDFSQLITSFYSIENHIFNFIKGQEKKAKYRTLFEIIENPQSDENKKSTLHSLLKFNQTLSNPVLAAQPGFYGIPMSSELDSHYDPTENIPEEIKEFSSQLKESTKMKNPILYSEKNGTLKNLILFSKQLLKPEGAQKK